MPAMTQEEIAKLFEGAPEGATHYSKENGYFYRANSMMLEVYLGSAWRPSELFKSSRAALIERPAPQWNGEGLPPVGMVCEVKDADGGWHRCEVLAHHLGNAVFAPAIDYPYGVYDGLAANFFRPIRTPEQIAAEKREAAIQAMNALVDIDSVPTWRDALAALYDAGLRFTEGGEQ